MAFYIFGITIFRFFLLGTLYRLIYGRKISFTVTYERVVKRDFRPIIVEYDHSHSEALLQFCLIKPHVIQRNDVKLFPTHNFLILSNQTSRYKVHDHVSFCSCVVGFGGRCTQEHIATGDDPSLNYPLPKPPTNLKQCL